MEALFMYFFTIGAGLAMGVVAVGIPTWLIVRWWQNRGNKKKVSTGY